MGRLGQLGRFLKRNSDKSLAIGMVLVGIGYVLIINAMSVGTYAEPIAEGLMAFGLLMIVPKIVTMATSLGKSTRRKAGQARQASGLGIVGYAAAMLLMSFIFLFSDPGFPNLLGLENPTGLFLLIVSIEVLLSPIFLKTLSDRFSFNLIAFFVGALVFDFLAAIILSGGSGLGPIDNIIRGITGGQVAYDLEVVPTAIYLLAMKLPIVALIIFLGAKTGVGGAGNNPVKQLKSAGNYIFIGFLLIIVLLAVSMPAYLVYMQTGDEFSSVIDVSNPILSEVFNKSIETAGPTSEFVIDIAKSVIPEDLQNIEIEFSIPEILGYTLWREVFGFPTQIRQFNETSGEYVTKDIPYEEITTAMMFFVIIFGLVIVKSSEKQATFAKLEKSGNGQIIRDIQKKMLKQNK